MEQSGAEEEGGKDGENGEQEVDGRAKMKRGVTLASGSGSYLEQIKYEADEEAIWTINTDISRMQWVEQIDE